MKIDTSNINLSSAWAFSEQNQVKFEQEVRFFDLFNHRLENFNAGVQNEHQITGQTNPWYETTTLNGQGVVELSRQFQNELEKMRQIFEAISQRLNATGSNGCCIHLARLDRININPYQRVLGMREYEYRETKTYDHREKETMDFFADGRVNTMDGRSIDFSFQMNLERDFFQQDQFVHSEKGYVLIDPLVINLNTTTPQFSETTALFDLDMDGEKEDMAMLAPGSGLLTLDKNKDGIINDGSELFGPSTGDGFAELIEYDLDHNYWIDENDAIFDDLTIWENTEQGDMQLTKIKDAGIGAIYLASAQTPFDLKNEDNQLQARIKKSGLALNEDGSVSSIQEMDWTA
ncbi:hypothetical protein [Desulfobacula sp.]|uniref:hypothetical protein n=1 Tax=Desulfobacula sp. TaxID=2593537 RepID=UPI0026372B1B|nr:hypothetical protein [Desulfobacula sp.]